MAEAPNTVSSAYNTGESETKDTHKNKSKDETTSKVKFEDESEEFECAVCLQQCIHPVRLPCKHIFCFLCVKGVANQSKRCAMCRQEIPATFLDHPDLLNNLDLEVVEASASGYQWFYEGRNGWWQYDERTSTELEASHLAGNRACEVLVAGFLYTIDFDRMIQMRRNDPSRRRRIKRDLSSIPKKGVAGIKFADSLLAPNWTDQDQRTSSTTDSSTETSLDSQEVSLDHSEPDSSISPTSHTLGPPTPIAPSNTPQTPHTPSTASSSGDSSPENARHIIYRPPLAYRNCCTDPCRGDHPSAHITFLLPNPPPVATTDDIRRVRRMRQENLERNLQRNIDETTLEMSNLSLVPNLNFYQSEDNLDQYYLSSGGEEN